MAFAAVFAAVFLVRVSAAFPEDSASCPDVHGTRTSALMQLSAQVQRGGHQAETADPFLVLCYNVWWWCNPGSVNCQPTSDYASLGGMHAYWKSLPRLGVVGVQECDGGWNKLKSYLGGSVDYLEEVAVNPDGPLCTLFDPVRFSKLSSGRRNVWSYRYVEYVRLRDRQTGKVVFFANTHWDHQAHDSEGHARNTAQVVQEFSQPDDVVFVVGDFNLPPTVHVFPQIFEQQLGLTLVGRGSSHAQIDMIWAKGVESPACQSPEDSGPAGAGSDHNPVLCELSAGASSPSPPAAPGPVQAPAPTPSAPLDGSSWVHHPNKNCYDGHGAQAVVGFDPAPQEMSIAACQAACEADALCEAIVMHSSQEGQCWLRKDVDMSACLDWTDYDVWMYGGEVATVATSSTTQVLTPAPSQSPTPASTPAPEPTPAPRPVQAPGPVPTQAPTPSTRPTRSWVHHPSKNCYADNGAQGVAGFDPAPQPMSIAECKAACQADADCEAIVMPSDHEVGQCWMRRDVDISACPTYVGFDVWMQVIDQNAPAPTSPPSPASTSAPTPAPTPAMPAQVPTPSTGSAGSSWVHHPDKNCYAGNGAQGIAGFDPAPQPLSIAECKAACEADASCQAIVMPSNQETGQCWLRRDVDMSACLDWVGYDVWMRVGAVALLPKAARIMSHGHALDG